MHDLDDPYRALRPPKQGVSQPKPPCLLLYPSTCISDRAHLMWRPQLGTFLELPLPAAQAQTPGSAATAQGWLNAGLEATWPNNIICSCSSGQQRYTSHACCCHGTTRQVHTARGGVLTVGIMVDSATPSHTVLL